MIRRCLFSVIFCSFTAICSLQQVHDHFNCSAVDISFIIAARNDGYGGDFLQRLRNTIDNLSRFAWRDHDVVAEVLIVSYNDGADGSTPLHRALRFQDGHWHDDNALVRFIIVPPSYHSTTENPLGISMHQYRAKNIGMRR